MYGVLDKLEELDIEQNLKLNSNMISELREVNCFVDGYISEFLASILEVKENINKKIIEQEAKFSNGFMCLDDEYSKFNWINKVNFDDINKFDLRLSKISIDADLIDTTINDGLDLVKSFISAIEKIIIASKSELMSVSNMEEKLIIECTKSKEITTYTKFLEINSKNLNEKTEELSGYLQGNILGLSHKEIKAILSIAKAVELNISDTILELKKVIDEIGFKSFKAFYNKFELIEKYKLSIKSDLMFIEKSKWNEILAGYFVLV